ncbi:DUF4190 domain-containing protein [Nocardia australiensis]|uniref:DUF4190 domain-containing protein n=1 Tax=Nocardia australiensis TaxID=2887191 RepID=UPI001D151150|nr:DUF4190 domain-containing protein [Nocardia australiensis]
MVRTERREAERWPQTQQEGHWSQPEPDDRWEEEESPERRADPEYEGRRRTGRLRVEVPPIINPYSVVALVAALVGLFPVAIVFGLIAFSHPRGKTMAFFALLLGILEVVAVAGIVLLNSNLFPDVVTRAGKTAAISASPTAAVPPTVADTALTTPVPKPTSAAVSSTTAANPGVVKQATACTDTQAGLIATTAEGSTLLCLSGGGSSGPYKWAGPFTVASTVAEVGGKCDSTGAKSARTADGRALVCEGRAWAVWITE